MRITEEQEIVFICLTLKEAKELADDLVFHIGEKQKPKTISEKLTNQLADMYLEEEN